MKAFNKLLSILNLDEDPDYDEYEDYEEDNYYMDEEEEKTSSFRSRTEKKAKVKEKPEEKPGKQVAKVSKITPMRSARRTGGYSSMELRVIKPTTFEDATDITDTLLSNRAVVLNLEGINLELAHRIMDFTYGSCYAINGNLRKVSNYILVITPESMDISGDFQELFAGAMESASFDEDF